MFFFFLIYWEGLTLVQRRGNRALDPGSVVIYHVDGEVGVPMRDNLHWTMALCPLRTHIHEAHK